MRSSSRRQTKATNTWQSASERLPRVERRTLPPLLRVLQFEDGEVQVRRVLRGVTRGADVADDLAACHALPLGQPGCVALEMRIVVGETPAVLELIDGDAAWLTEEQLGNGPRVHGAYRRV